MNRNYIILIAIALILALGILIIGERGTHMETRPQALAVNYNDPSRFLSSDEVTDRLIKRDPSLFLIDVRPADQFAEFSVPGSVNIPLDSLLNQGSVDMLSAENMDKVLISNSDQWSDQAWLICSRLGIPNVFVMEGGINNWFNTIAKLQDISPTAPQEVIDLQQFRAAANKHFFGSGEVSSASVISKPRAIPVKKAPKPGSSGGC